jgi:type VI secretion system protein ImpG
MIQSFALLGARIHKRLDDDFPLFTEALLGVLYPITCGPSPPVRSPASSWAPPPRR